MQATHTGGVPRSSTLNAARSRASTPSIRRCCIQDQTDIRQGVTDADIWELSPVRITWGPWPLDALTILDALYARDEVLFIGGLYDNHTATVEAQKRVVEAGNVRPFIAMNPMDGLPRRTEDGKSHPRSDAAVKDYRFALAEFDNMDMVSQLSFWHSIVNGGRVPVAALIDSGNKSIHAWLRVDLPSTEAWQTEIRDGLYHPDTGRMSLLGADRACQNPSRLSRLAGHTRAETNRVQQLLYLNPDAKPC
jgi:hypothetical protein